MNDKVGLIILENAYVGYFSCQIPRIQLGIIQCILQNFCSDFLRLLLTQFSFNFNHTMDSMVIGGNTGSYIFCRSAKFRKFYGTLKFFLTEDRMGREISRLDSYTFYRISLKRYRDIAYHDGIQAITFQSF